MLIHPDNQTLEQEEFDDHEDNFWASEPTTGELLKQLAVQNSTVLKTVGATAAAAGATYGGIKLYKNYDK